MGSFVQPRRHRLAAFYLSQTIVEERERRDVMCEEEEAASGIRGAEP